MPRRHPTSANKILLIKRLSIRSGMGGDTTFLAESAGMGVQTDGRLAYLFPVSLALPLDSLPQIGNAAAPCQMLLLRLPATLNSADLM